MEKIRNTFLCDTVKFNLFHIVPYFLRGISQKIVSGVCSSILRYYSSARRLKFPIQTFPGGSIGEIGGRDAESRFRDDRAFPWPPGPARLADVQPGIRLAPRRASSRA